MIINNSSSEGTGLDWAAIGREAIEASDRKEEERVERAFEEQILAVLKKSDQPMKSSDIMIEVNQLRSKLRLDEVTLIKVIMKLQSLVQLDGAPGEKIVRSGSPDEFKYSLE